MGLSLRMASSVSIEGYPCTYRGYTLKRTPHPHIPLAYLGQNETVRNYQ